MNAAGGAQGRRRPTGHFSANHPAPMVAARVSSHRVRPPSTGLREPSSGRSPRRLERFLCTGMSYHVSRAEHGEGDAAHNHAIIMNRPACRACFGIANRLAYVAGDDGPLSRTERAVNFHLFVGSCSAPRSNHNESLSDAAAHESHGATSITVLRSMKFGHALEPHHSYKRRHTWSEVRIALLLPIAGKTQRSPASTPTHHTMRLLFPDAAPSNRTATQIACPCPRPDTARQS